MFAKGDGKLTHAKGMGSSRMRRGWGAHACEGDEELTHAKGRGPELTHAKEMGSSRMRMRWGAHAFEGDGELTHLKGLGAHACEWDGELTHAKEGAMRSARMPQDVRQSSAMSTRPERLKPLPCNV